MICVICGLPLTGKECQQCESIYPKAKQWFGSGEIDVDAMVRCGAISKKRIIQMYKQEVVNSD